MEPRNPVDWGADAVLEGGRPHPTHRQREMGGDPTGSETLSMYGSTWHANREIPGLLQRPTGGALERSGKSEDARR
jgi:hypothetical protein